MNSWWLTPFALMLLSVALLPVVAPHWWHPNRNKLVLSLILSTPVLIYLGSYPETRALISHTAHEYVSFLVLLTALYIISGGIHLSGDLRATPLANSLFLLVGAVLASIMGTTGAAMVLVRPLLSTNAERTRVVHTVVFFIFLVANAGGCLTPLGDPPLFMGYLFGVPFLWDFFLFPQWLFVVAVLLAVYYVWDSIEYKREPVGVLAKDAEKIRPLRMQGLVNLLLLAGVVLSVAFVTSSPSREIILVVLTMASLKFTPPEAHKRNHFTIHPMVEVAVIFFGIFVTMIPAIELLKEHGPQLGVREAWHFFWMTGILSAVLDNTPTYVVFFNLAQSLHASDEIVGMSHLVLKAISLGAVFFGAMTYIGNAPNFMVRAIAEERRIRMPSFFGYTLYSVCVLLPIFALVSVIWFV